MDHYQKYLELLNKKKFVGGLTKEEIEIDYENGGLLWNNPITAHDNPWININYSFHRLYNFFLRTPPVLKLLKLSFDTICSIIKNKDEISLLLKLVYVDLSDDDVEILSGMGKYKDKSFMDKIQKTYKEFFKYDVKNVPIEYIKSSPNNKVFYIKDVINYFNEIAVYLQNLKDQFGTMITLEMAMMIDTTRLNYRIYNNFCYYYDLFTEKPTKDTSLFYKICNSEFKIVTTKDMNGYSVYTLTDTNGFLEKINEEYKILYDDSVITYLKIRCESKDEYNERFNVFLQPLEINNEEDCKKPQSMFLAGPDPNNIKTFYKTENEIKENAPTGSVTQADLDPAANQFIVDAAVGEVCFVKKYDYGIMY